MGSTVTTANSEENTWGGGNEPMGASYGKLMMWFFIVSDALTFSGFLAAYGFSRFKFIETWPIADEVFNASNIITKYKVTHKPKSKYRHEDIKYILLRF